VIIGLGQAPHGLPAGDAPEKEREGREAYCAKVSPSRPAADDSDQIISGE
jgi:hypothetical protein